MSLIVCNVPVVVTATVRLREHQEFHKPPVFSTFMKFATQNRTHKTTFATTGVTNITLGDGTNSIIPKDNSSYCLSMADASTFDGRYGKDVLPKPSESYHLGLGTAV